MTIAKKYLLSRNGATSIEKAAIVGALALAVAAAAPFMADKVGARLNMVTAALDRSADKAGGMHRDPRDVGGGVDTIMTGATSPAPASEEEEQLPPRAVPPLRGADLSGDVEADPLITGPLR